MSMADSTTTDRGRATTAGEKPLPLPDVGDLLFIFVLQLILFLKPAMLFADGSTGWHLVTGNYILDTGKIPHTDLISYTFPDKEWVAYEWLFDLFIAWLVRLGGTNLLAVVLSILIAFVFLMVYDRSRKEGAHFALACPVTLLSILTAAMHWLARPHLITFLGVYVFTTQLEDFYRGSISRLRLILTLTLFMVLWVNCHPAFLLGIALTGLYLVVSIIACLVRRRTTATWLDTRTQSLFLALASVSVATLANPYGFKLYEYIVHYLKGSTYLKETDEYMSPVFQGSIHTFCLEGLFLVFILGLFLTKARLTIPTLSNCLVFAHLALSAVRNMPLFAIVVTPAIGRLFSSTRLDGPAPNMVQDSHSTVQDAHSMVQDLPSPENENSVRVPGSRMDRFKKSLDDFNLQEGRCKMHLLSAGFAIFLIIVALNKGSLMGTPFLASDFDDSKPMKTLTFIKEHLKNQRGFNFDNWGGYLRYKLDDRMFIDDRADFYGEAFYSQYAIVSKGLPGWQDVLSKNKIDWVLFPANSRTAWELSTNKNWSLVAEDKASKLFVRNK